MAPINGSLRKILALIAISLSISFISRSTGFNLQQSTALTIFCTSIAGTLLFWNLRVSIVFLGTGILLVTGTLDLENFIKFASFEIILFLIGMMILMGFMKDVGFFNWVVTLILRIRKFTATKFLILISIVAAFMSCAVGEVTSIIFMVVAVLEICDYFEVNPVPFVITSVLMTNIGSSGTVLGNPVGILIAAKSGLTFEDFIVRAFPVMLICLAVAIGFVRVFYNKPLKDFGEKIKAHGTNDILIKLISVPPDRLLRAGMAFFIATLVLIGLHHRIETILGLEANVMLFTIPLISAGIVMMWRFNRVKRYIEEDIEWQTLLFFIFLFAQAGTIKFTGVSDVLAGRLAAVIGSNATSLSTMVIWVSSVFSSIVDNVVVVASFIPIIQSFQSIGIDVDKLWWALLFGGCFGGNITVIGSTANIVAVGLLENERDIKITFLNWFWIGLGVGIITTAISWVYLIFMK